MYRNEETISAQTPEGLILFKYAKDIKKGLHILWDEDGSFLTKPLKGFKKEQCVNQFIDILIEKEDDSGGNEKRKGAIVVNMFS